MSDTDIVATFSSREGFEAARRALETLGSRYEVLSPDPGFSRVGCPSLVVDLTDWGVAYGAQGRLVCSGWVEYRPAQTAVPSSSPPEYDEDVFGRAAVMVLAPCVAESGKVRLIAHLSGDLQPVMPYLNAVIGGAFYNPTAHILTFKDQHRLLCLYPRRIAVAKADDLVDGWRTLESIRCLANEVWLQRGEIAPSFATRKPPSFLEIYERLPRINCGLCGEPTCLAFAAQVWQGKRLPTECAPVYDGRFGHLREALEEITRGFAGGSREEGAESGSG
jgi:ArsR family metal-binding transcriptional regulator